MLKGHISSNFHGAGKFPTTKMKSFMVKICLVFLQTNSRQYSLHFNTLLYVFCLHHNFFHLLLSLHLQNYCNYKPNDH